MYTICHAVGGLLTSLPVGEPVWGVASLNDLLYVLRSSKLSEQIEVYDADCYRFQQYITVPELDVGNDMIACAHNRCAYISDTSNQCVHRIGLAQDTALTKWPVNDEPHCLSVTDTLSVLVTCDEARKIKEFSTDGKLLREIQLPEDVVSPCHTIQLSSGEFIVCHGGIDDRVHRVCLIGSDGGHVVKSFGGLKGSATQQINLPAHVAVFDYGFLFVADSKNHRVLLLSPALTVVRDVLPRGQLKWSPMRLWLDSDIRRLYVAVNEVKDGICAAGKLLVASV